MNKKKKKIKLQILKMKRKIEENYFKEDNKF